jgi:hypothetical protein
LSLARRVNKYVHPKRKAVELTGEDGRPVSISLTLTERLIAARRSVQEVDTAGPVKEQLRPAAE